MGRKHLRLWGTDIYVDDVEEDVDLTLTLGRSNSNPPPALLPVNPPEPYSHQDHAENGPIPTENSLNRQVNNSTSSNIVDLMIIVDSAMVIYEQANANTEAEASTSSGGHKRKNSVFNNPEKGCDFCHKTFHDTPNWRRGPNGKNTLCNACGLRYSKLAKRDS